MTNAVEVIEVRQLPIIAERLETIKAEVAEKIENALSLECNEDTYKEIKKVRADLNKLKNDYEDKRKAVKAEILKPYEVFEEIYKDCVSSQLNEADIKLLRKITEVENILKQKKTEEVERYYNEYRTFLNLSEEDAPFETADIKVTMSATVTALERDAKDHLDNVISDLHLIETQEHKDEILAEYRICRSAAHAIKTVMDRYKAIEAEQKKREEREAKEKAIRENADAVKAVAAVQDALSAPVTVPETPAEEKLYTLKFTVKAPLEKLKELKKFLNDGGYMYE